MTTFTLYWRDGLRTTVEGNDIADAMDRAGYSAGALRALDFHAKGDNHEYWWNALEREWRKERVAMGFVTHETKE